MKRACAVAVQGLVEFHQVCHEHGCNAGPVDIGGNEQIIQAGWVDRAAGDKAEQVVFVSWEAYRLQ
jgi:hypothetical protein